MTGAFLSPAGARWQAFGCSVIGASHIRNKRPNQDALAFHEEQEPHPITLVSVSDGHGAARHYRSDVGSKIAVEVSIRILREACLTAWANGIPDSIRSGLPGLVQKVVEGWHDAVLSHAKLWPCDRAHLRGLSKNASPVIAYGATLLMAIATERALVIAQLGDGDIMVGYEDGQLRRPLPSDALVGEQTYSLCQPDAERYFRFLVFDTTERPSPLFVMLSSDGVSKSYPSDLAFEQLADRFFNIARTDGLSSISSSLEAWMQELTWRGSGDDVTVAFMMRPQVSNPELPTTN